MKVFFSEGILWRKRSSMDKSSSKSISWVKGVLKDQLWSESHWKEFPSIKFTKRYSKIFFLNWRSSKYFLWRSWENFSERFSMKTFFLEGIPRRKWFSMDKRSSKAILCLEGLSKGKLGWESLEKEFLSIEAIQRLLILQEIFERCSNFSIKNSENPLVHRLSLHRWLSIQFPF